MFDIGWGELLIIGVVALIVIGPKELPTVLRTVGQWMGKVRRMASEFQGQFQEAMREAEFADLKKQVDEIGSPYNPLDAVRKEMEGALEDKPPAFTPASPAASATPLDPMAIDGGNVSATPLAAAAPVPGAEAPPTPAASAEPQLPLPAPAPDVGGQAFNPDQPTPPEMETRGGRAA